MRHQKKKTKIGGARDRDHKQALKRNMVTQLFMYERIYTSMAKAKFIRRLAERSITYAKNKEPREAIRELKKIVFQEEASKKVMEVLKDRYKDRPGGYTRIIKAGERKGDACPMVYLELVE